MLRAFWLEIRARTSIESSENWLSPLALYILRLMKKSFNQNEILKSAWCFGCNDGKSERKFRQKEEHMLRWEDGWSWGLMNGPFVTTPTSQSHHDRITIILPKFWCSTWTTSVLGCLIQVSGMWYFWRQLVGFFVLGSCANLKPNVSTINSRLFQLSLLLQLSALRLLGDGIRNLHNFQAIQWNFVENLLETNKAKTASHLGKLGPDGRPTNTHCFFLHALFECRPCCSCFGWIPCLSSFDESNDNWVSWKLCKQTKSQTVEKEMEKSIWSWTLSKFPASLRGAKSVSCNHCSVTAGAGVPSRSDTWRHGQTASEGERGDWRSGNVVID